MYVYKCKKLKFEPLQSEGDVENDEDEQLAEWFLAKGSPSRADMSLLECKGELVAFAVHAKLCEVFSGQWDRSKPIEYQAFTAVKSAEVMMAVMKMIGSGSLSQQDAQKELFGIIVSVAKEVMPDDLDPMLQVYDDFMRENTSFRDGVESIQEEPILSIKKAEHKPPTL